MSMHHLLGACDSVILYPATLMSTGVENDGVPLTVIVTNVDDLAGTLIFLRSLVVKFSFEKS